MMKQRIGAVLIGTMAFAVAGVLVSGYTSNAAEKKDGEKTAQDKVAQFMRVKLASSQNALEGLVTEDFDLIKQGAEKMAEMSKATEWQVMQGPIYA